MSVCAHCPTQRRTRAITCIQCLRSLPRLPSPIHSSQSCTGTIPVSHFINKIVLYSKESRTDEALKVAEKSARLNCLHWSSVQVRKDFVIKLEFSPWKSRNGSLLKPSDPQIYSPVHSVLLVICKCGWVLESITVSGLYIVHNNQITISFERMHAV